MALLQIGMSKVFGQKKAKQAMQARLAGLQEAQAGIKEAQGRWSGYQQYGQESLGRMNRLFQDPSYIEQLPGYQFTLSQGLKGTTAARSRTSIFSGETLKALTEYAAGLASQQYGEEWKRIQSGIETGFGAEQQYSNLATTSAEISAGMGEARARRADQEAAWAAGQESFGRQIFGQWSGAFASATAGKASGGGS